MQREIILCNITAPFVFEVGFSLVHDDTQVRLDTHLAWNKSFSLKYFSLDASSPAHFLERDWKCVPNAATCFTHMQQQDAAQHRIHMCWHTLPNFAHLAQ